MCSALLSTVPVLPQGDSLSSDSLRRKTEIACWLVSLARARIKNLPKGPEHCTLVLQHARGNTGVASAKDPLTVKDKKEI
jgi:hypothetical protein